MKLENANFSLARHLPLGGGGVLCSAFQVLVLQAVTIPAQLYVD